MASRRGIAATAAILAAVTAASFSIWLVPQAPDRAVQVSDFGSHLDGVRNVHGALSAELDSAFARFRSGEITAEQYAEMAEATSTQINSQIIQLVGSQAPEEWHRSYISYMDALKAQNAIIRETMVVAAGEAADAGGRGVDESLSRIGEIRSEMESMIAESARSAP